MSFSLFFPGFMCVLNLDIFANKILLKHTLIICLDCKLGKEKKRKGKDKKGECNLICLEGKGREKVGK